ncbi:MAG: exodeoxyribonuclease III [Comamonadaceae bacterium]|nr:exodeoxyribonuclease III [Comamonadaceae bacterium]
MKIATWNVNSLSIRLPQVLDWLAANPVDVLCLQELKLTDDKFPLAALEQAGYPHCAVFGQKTYNGVALISQHPLSDVLRNIAGFEDEQARVVSATVQAPGGDLRVVNGYFVNGQEPGSEKFAYKMNWLQGLHRQIAAELAGPAPLVLVGDFNITADDRDTHDPQGLRETIHHTTQERQAFAALLGLGLVDAFRLFDQPEKSYSWWDYREMAFRRNKGLRIDHILVSPSLKARVKACTIDRSPRKNERPSDHAPVIVELAEPVPPHGP